MRRARSKRVLEAAYWSAALCRLLDEFQPLIHALDESFWQFGIMQRVAELLPLVGAPVQKGAHVFALAALNIRVNDGPRRAADGIRVLARRIRDRIAQVLGDVREGGIGGGGYRFHGAEYEIAFLVQD